MCSCKVLLPQQGWPFDLFSPDRWQLILAASSRRGGGGYTLDITGWAYKTQITVHTGHKCMSVECGRKQEELESPCLPPIHSPANAGQPVPSQVQESDFSWTLAAFCPVSTNAHVLFCRAPLIKIASTDASKMRRFAPMQLRRWEIPLAVEEQGLPPVGACWKDRSFTHAHVHHSYLQYIYEWDRQAVIHCLTCLFSTER